MCSLAPICLMVSPSAIRAQTSCFSSAVRTLRLAMPEQPTAGGSEGPITHKARTRPLALFHAEPRGLADGGPQRHGGGPFMAHGDRCLGVGTLFHKHAGSREKRGSRGAKVPVLLACVEAPACGRGDGDVDRRLLQVGGRRKRPLWVGV